MKTGSFKLMAAAIVVVNIALLSGIGYVAFHFISKWW